MNKSSKINMIKQWVKRHYKPVLLVLALVVLGTGAVFAHQTQPFGKNRVERTSTTQNEQPLTLPSLLTGVEVSPNLARRPVIAVMIENSPDARPQRGLDSAGIVFEAVAEGGITRYLALFQEDMPSTIGPIRSVRPYFVDWYMGFDASVAHVGGSAEGLQLISRRSGKTLDQFRHSGPYFRESSRFAPHNMYARTSDLRSLQSRLGHNRSQFKEIPRSDDSPAENPSATRITVDYSSSLYQAQFRYRQSDNSYIRYLAGSPHIDQATNQPITVKNVVVIRMPTRISGQYAVMDTIGSGEALVFKDGGVSKVRWRQSSYRNRIELINSNDEQVALNRGDTWFAILPSGRSVTY